MSDRLFQYQARAEPVYVEPVVETPTGWDFQRPDPVRRLLGRDSGWFTSPSSAALAESDVSVAAWFQSHPDPRRNPKLVPDGFTVGPIGLADHLVPTGWDHSQSLPPGSPRRALPGWFTTGSEDAPAEIPYDWDHAQSLPAWRIRRSPEGGTAGPLNLADLLTPTDWMQDHPVPPQVKRTHATTGEFPLDVLLPLDWIPQQPIPTLRPIRPVGWFAAVFEFELPTPIDWLVQCPTAPPLPRRPAGEFAERIDPTSYVVPPFDWWVESDYISRAKLRLLVPGGVLLWVDVPSPPPVGVVPAGAWVMAELARSWIMGVTSGAVWVMAELARSWIMGGDMAQPLVLNEITEAVPGAGTVVWGADFGNLPEVVGGDLVASCSVSVTPVTAAALPALTVSSATINAGGYMATAQFSGGAVGTYLVTWRPTLVSGQVLPPRACALTLQ